MKFIHEVDETSYKHIVFSFGTYEKYSYEQMLFPLLNTTIRDTIIFAIDPQYDTINTNILKINRSSNNSLELVRRNAYRYYCEEYNVEVFLVPQKIESEYNQYRYNEVSSFSYCRQCPAKGDDWKTFYSFLNRLIEKRKKIYINNWVFTNSRYFREVNGVIRAFNGNIGHFFEYFPELGFILYKLSEETNYTDIYVTGYFENGISVKNINFM
jgi:hypothetical protein